jgi:hypothetical protein
MKSLTIAGCVCGVLALFFLPIVFAPLGMIFGAAALAKGRAENGLAVIVLAAVCGYYGFTSSLHPLDFISTAEIVSYLRSDPAPIAVATDGSWHVVSLQSHVATNDVDPVCSWKLQIKNDSPRPATFHGTVEFQDDHGVKIAEDRVDGYPVAPGAVGVFTGSVVVKSKTKIARAVPQIAIGG